MEKEPEEKKGLMDSKKAKMALATQGVIVIVAVACLGFSGGDPEKAGKLVEAVWKLVALLTAVGGGHVTIQGLVDAVQKFNLKGEIPTRKPGK